MMLESDSIGAAAPAYIDMVVTPNVHDSIACIGGVQSPLERV